MNLRSVRRRCEATLRRLDVPDPFDVATVCDRLGEQPGRKIVLERVGRRPSQDRTGELDNGLLAAPPEDHDVMGQERYVEPGWFTRNVFNRAVATLTRSGLSVWGSRILRVRGRRAASAGDAGQPADLQGQRYLVAPRGQTQWVRNLRAAGEGELRVGRRVERFRGLEVDDVDKPDILRAYLKRWKAEVGIFFGGVGAGSPEVDLLRIAPNHPVFQVQRLP